MTAHDKFINAKAKAEGGDPAAQRQLGWAYEKGEGVAKDLVEALAWYKKAAGQGHAVAQNDVGCAYKDGLGVSQDFDQALRWFRMSADQGHVYGQYNLGYLHYMGKGTPENFVESAKWFSKAAEQGHSHSAYYLGWLYATGNGVEKSHSNAIFWYRKAADAGVAGAQNSLAGMLERGQGVTADRAEAIRWYRKSAKLGNEEAKKSLERLKVPIEEPAAEPAPIKKSLPREPKVMVTESTGCKPLLAAATPHLYIHNAFRITGLPVDASNRDIKRRVDDLKAAAEIGHDDEEHTHAFALSPRPTTDHIREAAQRLQDPERRIIEEFFWFWPSEWGQGRSDSALTALRNGDKDAAFKFWSDALADDVGRASIIAKHNLAVMYHMVALDSEHLALKSDLSSEQLATVTKYWTTCFARWEELAEDENFWSIVADRIRHLDDERLTTGFARRMRTTFQIAFDRINALLALQYAEKEKFLPATTHVAFMNRSHHGAENVDSVITDVFKPVETRINNAVEKALVRAKGDPTQGAEATRELLETTKQPLMIARRLLPEGHTIRSYSFEHVSDACFTCLIAYGNKTEDWPTCVALLKLTEPLAVTNEARNKIRTNIAQAEKNHQEHLLYGMCWFCKQTKAEAAHVLEAPMHGDINREWRVGGTRTTFRTLTAKVPRCGACKEAHSKVAGKWAGAAAGAAVGTAIMPVVGSAIGFFAGKALGKMVDKKMRLPDGVAAESAKADFPPIKQLISEGWAFGEKPS